MTVLDDAARKRIESIGPPPPMPMMCFYCATDTCRHSNETKRSSVHGGGLIPAITAFGGTYVCLDCADRFADGSEADHG